MVCCNEPCIVSIWVGGKYVLQCLNCSKIIG